MQSIVCRKQPNEPCGTKNRKGRSLRERPFLFIRGSKEKNEDIDEDIIEGAVFFDRTYRIPGKCEIPLKFF